jgi:AraC-like DNA-binding protein
LLLKDFKPSPVTQDHVQLYRIVHLAFDKQMDVPFKAYPPRPEHCLAFYPLEREKVIYEKSGRIIENIPVVLYGQPIEVTHRYIGHQFLVLQIIFLPGALYGLTGIPATSFTNEYLDAELVFSTSLREVNEQLYHANGYDHMIRIAEHFVECLVKKRTRKPDLADAACRLILQQGSSISLDKLASLACLSHKQLERKFKERTGVNPMHYSRITRFDKAFRLKNSFPHYDWLRIAIECGYHDYQHLAKDYKDFTGLTPVAFHQVENKAPERAFGLSENYQSCS